MAKAVCEVDFYQRLRALTRATILGAMVAGTLLMAVLIRSTPALAQADIQDPFAEPAPAATPGPTATPFVAPVIEPTAPPGTVDVRDFAAPVNTQLASPQQPPATAPLVNGANGANGATGSPLVQPLQPGFDVGPGGVQQPLPVPQGLFVPQQLQAPASALPPQPQLSPEELAFERAYQRQLPLTPDQIRTYSEERNLRLQAGSQGTRPPGAIPPYRSVDISLAPGVEPPMLFTGVGEVTAVAFFDVTGAPYPLASIVVGNPARFSVAVPNDGGNLMTITPLEPYAFGNVVVSLLDQPVPIVIKMRAGEGRVDYRVDMRVGVRGPQAPDQAMVLDRDPQPGTPELSTFLSGLNVSGARPLTLRGGPGMAWQYNGSVYVRTPLAILSPGWIQRAAGPSGYYVYQLPSAPVLRASDDGQLVTLTLEGLDD